jgi:hypothetical protein
MVQIDMNRLPRISSTRFDLKVIAEWVAASI